MAYDVYSTAQLVGAFQSLETPNRFFFDLCFKDEQLFDSTQVVFDLVQRARRIAPLVSPNVEGKVEKLRGYNARSVTPAYLKPKHQLEPGQMLVRRPGEVLAGSLSPQERMQVAILDALKIQNDQISRFEELMAISLMTTGAMNITTPDFGSLNIDMGRDPANTVVLTGATTWGSVGVNPLDSLVTWSAAVQAKSGYIPRVAVMDPKAYLAFIRSTGVSQIMQSYNQKTGYVDLAGNGVGGVGNEAYYVGHIGSLDVWVYQQYYQDDQGNQQQYMPDNTVILADPDNCGGMRLYGAIQDVEGFVPATRYPKMWVQHDPSSYAIMTQSAPLAILGLPNATFCAKVA